MKNQAMPTFSSGNFMRYLLDRLIQSLIVIIIVSTVIFLIVRMTGNPLDVVLDPRATTAIREAVAEKLGLSKPLVIQYFIFMGNILRGDFGKSFISQEPCLQLVLQRLPATLELTILAMALALIIAIPIGVYSAANRGKFVDIFGRAFAFTGMAAPIFWTGIMGIWIFAVKLHILPAGGRGGVENLIMPVVTLGWVAASGLLRLTRSSMMDVLNTDYIIMARAKGLSNTVVLWKHALRNAALPVLTFFVLLFILVIGGAVVTETVFSWPGLGRLLIFSVQSRDYPMVKTIVILLCVLYIGANFLVDILYSLLNPKITHQ
jgi:peptide/nickel transport system permease protein